MNDIRVRYYDILEDGRLVIVMALYHLKKKVSKVYCKVIFDLEYNAEIIYEEGFKENKQEGLIIKIAKEFIEANHLSIDKAYYDIFVKGNSLW